MERDNQVNEVAKEIEILEFRAGGNSYGINVNDIREILPFSTKPTLIPNANPCIEGIIKPRDFLISIIDLAKVLKLGNADEYKSEMLIVTSICNLNIALHVDSVRGIHRALSTEITKPGKKLSTTFKAAVAGILPHEDYVIEVLDYNGIFKEVNQDVSID
jgi:two-component system chemotaxis response regulator CheV